MKVIKHKDKWYLQSDTGYKEILLSTDDQLIKDGVQAIDDEFLEWFVKNPSCEVVEVKEITTIPALQLGSPNGHLMYKIIIPKEEPKQKTLEEVAQRLHPEEWDWRERKIFIAGAKWQQERSYNEEEVLELVDMLFHKYSSDFRVSAKIDTKEWFEQFKKK